VTPQQAEAGLVELVLPEGGHVLVGFGEGASGDPAHEASVVQLMLDATGGEDEVAVAIANYAETSGLVADLTVDAGSLVVRIR
jgi:hypothetical protein